MDVRLVDCQIEGCDEPARYEVFLDKKNLFVCRQHFYLISANSMKRRKGGGSRTKNGGEDGKIQVKE